MAPYYGSSGGGVFSGLVTYLDNFGITDIIIPFVLIFTILFAVLQRIKLFGDQSKKYNVVIALAIALLSIFPHVTGRYQDFDIVNVINSSLPQIGLILIALVLLMVLVGLVSGKEQSGSSSLILGLAGILGVVLLVVVFWRALFPYSTPTWLSFLDDPSIQALIIILVVFGLIVWFVTKEPNDGKGKGMENVRKGFGELFGGSK
jgi:hypothetical protein